MPSILTLEGPNLGRGASPGCVNCATIGDAASDATNLAKAIAAYATQIASIQRTATILGVIGGLVGAVAGSMAARYIGKGRGIKYGTAAGGGLLIGLGSFYATRQALTPPFVPPQTTAQQILTRDLP